jgi:hypothetical protein
MVRQLVKAVSGGTVSGRLGIFPDFAAKRLILGWFQAVPSSYLIDS